mgnify:CR=1 FL=1
MGLNDMDWPNPLWRFYKRHRPPPREQWSKLVKDTSQSEAMAYYCPGFDIETWEMECVNGALLKAKGNGVVNECHEIVRDNPHEHVREFWMNCKQLVGASKGEETEYLFAQWEVCGGTNEVHGRPMTKEQLKQRGVRL